MFPGSLLCISLMGMYVGGAQVLGNRCTKQSIFPQTLSEKSSNHRLCLKINSFITLNYLPCIGKLKVGAEHMKFLLNLLSFHHP